MRKPHFIDFIENSQVEQNILRFSFTSFSMKFLRYFFKILRSSTWDRVGRLCIVRLVTTISPLETRQGARDKEVTLRSFPINKEQRWKWVKALRSLVEKTLSSVDTTNWDVCDKHLRRDDFLEAEIAKFSADRKLKCWKQSVFPSQWPAAQLAQTDSFQAAQSQAKHDIKMEAIAPDIDIFAFLSEVLWLAQKIFSQGLELFAWGVTTQDNVLRFQDKEEAPQHARSALEPIYSSLGHQGPNCPLSD